MQKKLRKDNDKQLESMAKFENLPEFKVDKLSPMLLKKADKPFNSNDYIFELKFDGFRCIAEITKENTNLHSRRGGSFNSKFPELICLHKQCKSPCILDGEIVFINNLGVPDFSFLQKRRALLSKIQIEKYASEYPTTFVAFDIISANGKDLTIFPLLTRKDILKKLVNENSTINIIRYIENNGIDLFNAIKEKGLEGIIAKKKNSIYHIGKRRDDWVKITTKPHDEYRQFNNKLKK